MNRTVIKIAGESGQGLNSIGEIVGKALKRSGLHVFGYREYPSLIKGGFASYQLEFSDHEISAPSQICELLVCLSRVSIHEYLPSLANGGILIHSIANFEFTVSDKELVDSKNIKVHYVDAEATAVKSGGSKIMENTVLSGLIWKLLGLQLAQLEPLIQEKLKHKPDLVPANVACLKAGFQLELPVDEVAQLHHEVKGYKMHQSHVSSLLLSGNEAIALGAIAAGVRAYYGYPMTPSSPIHTYLAEYYHDTGMLVKQAEDEITAVQMAIGSMFMGTRALTATSGGGFDLMTETISLSGMTETPLVVIIGQRPGPSTGMPTWTSASDLDLALHAGHGEFPRCVIAASDTVSAYTLIQRGFNIAEKYQLPVLMLTEKQIGESLFNIEKLPPDIPIDRGLEQHDLAKLKSSDRYEITDAGTSKRWLPGQKAATYLGNSDEHLPDGSVAEGGEEASAMYAKRMRKLESLASELPEPLLLDPNGDELDSTTDVDTVIVGWGAAKNSLLDALKASPDNIRSVAYLHYEYLWPLNTSKLGQLAADGKRLILLENNYTGQLGKLIRQQTGINITEKWLKWNGRPFYVEEIIEKLNTI